MNHIDRRTTMAIYGSTHWLEVWGDLAGFFPPDAKVEAYSYPIITPSAARNIFRAIYMNPYQFEWVVQHIATVSEPQYIGIKTNEFATEKGKRELVPWSAIVAISASAGRGISASRHGRRQADYCRR
jgi:CRISPR-associated Cas5-like protein